MIQNNKPHLHHVGIPFFKKENDVSESSRRTKAITTNF